MSKSPTRAVAYYRVSTAKQGASGLGLESQIAAVEAYAQREGLTLVRGGNDVGDGQLPQVGDKPVMGYVEIETGTRKRQRAEIQKAIAFAKRNGYVLLIAKLDRLARNVHFISGLMESGVKFVAVDLPQVSNLTLHILAAVAEEEARMISARTKAALQAAKARGVKLGKPENLTDAARELASKANRTAAQNAYAKTLGYINTLRSSGLAYRAIAQRLNEDGYSTRTGKTFAAMTVKRICDRAGK